MKMIKGLKSWLMKMISKKISVKVDVDIDLEEEEKHG